MFTWELGTWTKVLNVEQQELILWTISTAIKYLWTHGITRMREQCLVSLLLWQPNLTKLNASILTWLLNPWSERLPVLKNAKTQQPSSASTMVGSSWLSFHFYYLTKNGASLSTMSPAYSATVETRISGWLIFTVNLAGFGISMETHLGVSMEVFPGRMDWEGKTRPECRWCHPMRWSSRRHEKEKRV